MKKQNIVKLVFIFILSTIVLVIISNINKETNYLNFEYKIESIDYREKGVYLNWFQCQGQFVDKLIKFNN